MEIALNGDGFRFVMSWGFMVIVGIIVVGIAMISSSPGRYDDGRMK